MRAFEPGGSLAGVRTIDSSAFIRTVEGEGVAWMC
jgi:hypothetical protein